ncbi:tetratricopeptide repeat protein [Anaeromyxobacter oryzisoli]|uniref:tetratricopeptide repeat protein n=1 Tax=Anaeromyxobacter oryzisoli TaxID=2925408 RepID=UPI001F570687|nr:tetratricopeptide repeat protein [Anaeromyxobacter sp. SG63]
MTLRRSASLLASGLLLACATAGAPRRGAPAAPGQPAAATTAPAIPPAPAAPPRITYPPEEVKASPTDVELEGKNDEELFAIGTAAYGAGEYARAAAAFARLVDRYPSSRHEAAALFDAGLAYQHLEEWRLALERFRALERKYEGPDALEASFKIADCLYYLHELPEAHARLEEILRREGLDPTLRIRALAQRGVLELEAGKAEEAERSFRLALGAWQGASEEERLDPYYPSLAQYYLGETYRTWFRALPLDPSTGDEARLRQDLEHKAEMLLSAQGHYLRAIRMGDDRWAVAAGFRIGELYDELRKQLLEAPLPPGLDAEHAAAYRAELRRRVRVLAAKAITAYEQTIARASRTGVDDLRFLADAQASLSRLEAALAEDAEPPRT